MLNKELSVQLYQSVSDENAPRVMEHWHASSLAACPRNQYFNRLGVPYVSKPSGAKILRWSAGHNIEQAIRPHIEKLYKGIGSNERMTSEALDLTGEFDNYSEEMATLVEIKSVSDFAFLERNGVTGLKEQVGTMPNGNKRWGLKNKPYLHHEWQQHAYNLLLRELGKPLFNIDYVYISLNGRIVGYKTEVQDQILADVTNRLNLLNEAWKTQTPPACICNDTENEMYAGVLQWCDYREGNDCCSLELLNKSKENNNG